VQFARLLRSLRSKSSLAYFGLSALPAFVDPNATLLLWFIGVLTIGIHSDWRSDGDWWPGMLEVLGLAPLVNREVPPMTPILRLASAASVIHGQILGGRDARRQLLMYSTTPAKTESGAVTQNGDFTFTAVLFQRPLPNGIPFIGAAPAISRADRIANTKFATLTAGQRGAVPFSVESVALHDRFDLRCSPGAEADARRLFSPTFMVWFAEHGLPFECEHGYLAVYVPHHIAHRDVFRDLMDRADRIYAELDGR
jgi:hypothetical protein